MGFYIKYLQITVSGLTILLYKDKGNPEDLDSLHPIIIFSVVSRIIEKSINQNFRHFTNFSHEQRGFVSDLPRTHINRSIVNGVLKAAKSNKKVAV